MRKIGLMVIAVLLVTMAIGASTVAYFNATATSPDNEFVAGTLELAADRDNGDTVPGPMFYPNALDGATVNGDPGLYPDGFWKPGDVKTKVFQIENIGSLDGVLTSVKASLEDGQRHFADKLLVTVTTDEAGTNVVASGTLGDLMDNAQSFIGGPMDIASGDLVSLWFTVSFPNGTPSEDNPYQGESVKVQFAVNAETK